MGASHLTQNDIGNEVNVIIERSKIKRSREPRDTNLTAALKSQSYLVFDL
jgi:hypothetical protein